MIAKPERIVIGFALMTLSVGSAVVYFMLDGFLFWVGLTTLFVGNLILLSGIERRKQ